MEAELLSGEDPVLSQLQSPIPQIFASFLNSYVGIEDGVKHAPPATDLLEIALRRRCVDLLQSIVSSSESRIQALNDVQLFWGDTLRAIFHIVQTVENDGETKSIKDSELSDGATQRGINSAQRQSILPNTSFLRRIPIVLLDDILDTVSVVEAFSFWKATVPGSLLFSHTLWEIPTQHPCWLPFLKTANKFMRKLQSEGSIEPLDETAEPQVPSAASDVLVLLSTVYPLSEKSATRTWGSHNADHWTEFESEMEFDIDVEETTRDLVGNNGQKAPPPPSFSFYETFWKLQHDFRNLNGIAVAEFLHRLKTVLNCLKSLPLSAGDTQRGDQELILLPYLTHSRLLPIQLTDPGIRTIFLTQVFVVARHLMSQVPPLRAQLQAHLTTAESLFPDKADSLRIDRIVGRSEEQWRTWKQKKFVPDLEKQQKRVLPSTTKSTGKRKRDIDACEPVANVTFDWMGDDLASVVSKMKATVPSQKDHLEDYVEALDPESGIEAEYHPKNNAAFCWRTLRLLADTEHLTDFGCVYPNGDFEGMVRHMYAKDYGVDIPGEGIVPYHDVDDADDADATVLLEVEAPQNTDSIAEIESTDKGDDDHTALNGSAKNGNDDSARIDVPTEDVEMKDTINSDDTPKQLDSVSEKESPEEGQQPNPNPEPMSIEPSDEKDPIALVTATAAPIPTSEKLETPKPNVQADEIEPIVEVEPMAQITATDALVPTSEKAEDPKPNPKLEIAPNVQQNGAESESKVLSTPSVATAPSVPVSVNRPTSSGSDGKARERPDRTRPDSDGRVRDRDGPGRSRPDNGVTREPAPRPDLGARDKDFGGSARRPDPSRDGHGRRDDRPRGRDENARRDDRRGGSGDNEVRRDDRRDGELRRDEWRGNRDAGKDRFDRGRGDYDNDRRGGRSNSGRR